MLRALITACVVAAGLTGCGGGELQIKLVPAGFDDPFSQVAQMVVTLLDDSFQSVSSFTADGTKTDVELGEVDGGVTRRLSVQGLDSGSNVLSRGASRAISFSGDGVELIPFSSLRVASALPVAQAFSGSPAVDGDVSEWVSSPSIVLDADARVSGPADTGATDVRAEVYFAWSPSELRFAVVVVDDCTTLVPGKAESNCQPSALPDRVVIAFDGTDNGGSYGNGDVAIELTANKVTPLAGTIQRAQLKVVFGLLANRAGWLVEGSIALTALGRSTIAERDRVGVDVTVIDEDPDQSEPAVLRFSKAPGAADVATPPDSMSTLGFGQP